MDKFYLKQTDDALDLPIPRYMTKGAAGMDLHANVHDDVVISPGDIHFIPTGIQIALPSAFEAQIRPRSGLALRHGISFANGVGTIDSDYRGEIGVILINHGKEDFIVHRSDRIGQIVINQIKQVDWEITYNLEDSERMYGGFGHTGK